jgi:hypothetical protein
MFIIEQGEIAILTADSGSVDVCVSHPLDADP